MSLDRCVAGKWLRLAVLLVAAMLCAATTVLHAQVCGVPGHQGLVTTASFEPNSYFAGSGSVAAGASSLTLASGTNANRGATTTLLAGDLVLIIQMQDSSGALAGNYEYAVVTVGGGVGATIQLGAPLQNAYAQSVSAGTVRTYQVVRIPQYSAATISGAIDVLPWYVDPATGNGTGGIYAIDVAGTLTMNGATINAMGKGFRGARGVNSTQNRTGSPLDASYACTPATLNGAFKGEGTAGIPQQVFGYNIGATAGAGLNYDGAGQLFNAGQGYAGGSCGQAALGNAGGGGNDGQPGGQANGYNSGGGGGGNAGAGGIGGNSWNGGDNTTAAANNPVSVANSGLGGFDAGGRGGNGLGPDVTARVYLGGGGGAGGSNNGEADVITTFPPTNIATANGATGSITSSGAPGGGIVLIRAGTLVVSAASTINAYGIRSYNKNTNASTDAAGGGGGGGTVIMDVPGTGAIANLTINASGGIGGNSNYYNHGPGGGGGGGYVATSFTGATINVAGGAAGTDGCCGGTAGNLSPKNYRAAAGANGTAVTGSAGVLPPGSGASARCLPNLSVTKVANTPAISAATGATASYTINVRNTGGAATNVYLFDTSLPPGWVYRTTAPAPVYAYSPAPPLAGGAFAAGAHDAPNTPAIASPPVLPVNATTLAASVTAVVLRGDGVAPRRVPTAGQGSVTFGGFFVPQNGSISVTFGVTIPNTATVGTYHNPAGAVYLDPTRNVTTGRMVAMATNVNANRNSLAYSGNTSFQTGGTTTIPGSHYSGLVAGPTDDDVVLLADLSITKTAPATAAPASTFSYTLTPRNNGRALGVLTYAATQATPLADGAAIGAAIGASPLTLTDTLPDGMRMTTTFAGTGWTCTGTATAVCTLPAATAFPRAAATNFPTLSGVVSPICGDSGVKINTVQIQQATGALITANNTATVSTTISPACATATLTISKASSPTGSLLTGSTVSYTLTVANLGPSAAPGAVVIDEPGAGLNCTAGTVSCSVLAGSASCPASPTVAALTSTGLSITPTFNASSTVAFVVTCGVTATGL